MPASWSSRPKSMPFTVFFASWDTFVSRRALRNQFSHFSDHRNCICLNQPQARRQMSSPDLCPSLVLTRMPVSSCDTRIRVQDGHGVQLRKRVQSWWGRCCKREGKLSSRIWENHSWVKLRDNTNHPRVQNVVSVGFLDPGAFRGLYVQADACVVYEWA